MKNNNWKGILKVESIEHLRNSKILWKQEEVYNQLHSKGELFLLNCCFSNNGSYPPENYFFGLDNRESISKNDEVEDLQGEPSENGYNRQTRSSNGGFTVEFHNEIYRASSNIMTFYATGDGWGPVKNIFLTSYIGDEEILISSAALSQSISLINGDSINLRMALSLS